MWQLIKFLVMGTPLKKCQHKFIFVNIQPYKDVSYVTPGIASVMYTKVCIGCGEHRRGEIYGCNARSPEELNIDPQESK